MSIISLMIFLSVAQRPVSRDSRPVILAFGDSLTAAYGVQPSAGYPARLQKKLDEQGYKYRVVSMGISGDTTSGGLARMRDALAEKPATVILELGANVRERIYPSTFISSSEPIKSYRNKRP